jgi:ribosomal protein S18 acetylase RimI-like enzyme
MADTLILKDVRSLKESEAAAVIEQIARIEKRTFPSSEAFDFNMSLWSKKPNTRVIYGTISGQNHDVIAYAVYIRLKGTALLHKICIAEAYRRKGLGKLLMEHVKQRLQDERCQDVHLWVDADREAAHRLYLGSGFEERERMDDYYGPGRTGIKMVLNL